MADTFRLDGKVAVVTGASKNIGLATSRTLALAGATVVMVSRNETHLRQRAYEIAEESGAQILHCAADVGVEVDLLRLVNFVHEQFPQVDVLVNNAYHSGGTRGLHLLDISDAAWEATFAINVLAPYRLVKGFGRRMLSGRGGSVINVLSGSGFLPTPGGLPYGATKAALWTMTKYMSNELAPSIRVNAICPGLTTSAGGGPPITDSVAQHALSQTPMGRAGHPSEVSPAILYLASDAASYTTGALLTVNGGRPWG